MDIPHTTPRNLGALARQLSNLKLVSRLLGHELHTQGGSKTITLSRDEVQEIQTTLDLYIEEVSRLSAGLTGGSGLGAGGAGSETRMVGTNRG